MNKLTREQKDAALKAARHAETLARTLRAYARGKGYNADTTEQIARCDLAVIVDNMRIALHEFF